MDILETNERKFICPKCQVEQWIVVYKAAQNFNIGDKVYSAPEHFECDCNRCGFSWKEDVKLKLPAIPEILEEE